MPTRAALRALLPVALHGLARELDASVGVLLRSTLDLPDFVRQAVGLVDLRSLLARLGMWLAAGAVLWMLLAAQRARSHGLPFSNALDEESASFSPLYLRPCLTLLALVSLALQPTFPYGFTLPVALTQDWGIAQDALALVTFAGLRVSIPRLPSPTAGGVFFMTFLAYALLTPGWARQWDAHPGNEPKYLRMALALGQRGGLDVEGIDGPMEEMTPPPIVNMATVALGGIVNESLRMGEALLRGRDAVGASAIRASRLARQTIRGKEGGVYHVLAPGPSLLLAPTLRLDRALNLARGVRARLAVTVLAWNAMGAALVAVIFLLLRDATGRPGLSAALAGAFAVTPPFLFYFFQFYPEMPGALLLAVAIRAILFAPRWAAAGTLGLGLSLAFLPWLHQKFLPVWAVLLLMAVLRAVDEMVTLRALLALLLPQAVTLYFTALYNFAVTGSVRPDALYLAWGPAGVTTAHIGQGFIGLLLDARWGILPYAPVYLLAGGGLLVAGANRLRWAAPAMAVYYLTVASADDWNGAASNLGRYFMPVAPFLVGLIGVALASVSARRGALTLALALFAWTGLVAIALWQDPWAANDAAVLLDKSAIADGHLYLPNLFIRAWSDGTPGLGARILAWFSFAAIIGVGLRRAALGRGGVRPLAVLAGVSACVLGAALALERWPSEYRAPRFHDGLDVQPGTVVFVSGSATVERDFALARSGAVELLVRSRSPFTSLEMLATGHGLVRVPGQPALSLPPSGVRLAVPLEIVRTLTGRRGVQETLLWQRIGVDAPDGVALRFTAPPPLRPE